MELQVKDIMLTNVITISPDLSLDILEQELLQDEIGGAPVVEKGELIGLVCRSDIVKQLAIEQDYAVMAYDHYVSPANLSKDNLNIDAVANLVGRRIEHLKVRDIMTSSIVSVTPTQSLREAADLMLERKIHRLLVVEAGKLVGVVSATDFTRLYSSQHPGSPWH